MITNKVVKTLHLNFASASRRTLEGKEYLVVPMVMIKEGVLNNIYYPKSEIAKFPQAWNGNPITVRHPIQNGTNVSANLPLTFEEFKIGYIFNTVMEDDKLKAEAWFDIAKANVKCPIILKNIHNNNPMDVSTGLFVEEIQEQGTFGNKEYSSIAINYRPDHLAILIDEKGACSWEDGAGIPRINKNNTNKNNSKEKEQMDKEKKNEETPVFNKDQLGVISTIVTDALKENKKEMEVSLGEMLKPFASLVKEDAPKANKDVPKEEKKPEPIKFNTMDDVYDAVPKAIANTLKNAVGIYETQRQERIKSLVDNKKCAYSEDQLKAKDLDELGILFNMVKEDNYEGKSNTDGYAQNEDDSIPNAPNMIEFIQNKNKGSK